MRARFTNLLRRLFPHPAVIAQRDRGRAARAGAARRAETEKEKRDAMTARLRAEITSRELV